MTNTPLSTTTLPKYEVIEFNGRPARRYQDGAIRDERGRMLANLPGTEDKRINAENAPALSRRRAENYRRAALRRIVGEAQSVDPSVSTGADAYAIVAAKQWAALMDYDKPRIDELKTLRDLMTGLEAVNDAPAQVVTHVHQMDADTVALLEQIAQAQTHTRSEIIDAE